MNPLMASLNESEIRQPVVYASIHWMADGFFDENPTIDLPRR